MGLYNNKQIIRSFCCKYALKSNTYANTNFFAGGTAPSSDALLFNVAPGPGVLGGIVPFPGGGGTPQMPSGSVIGSNFDRIHNVTFYFLIIKFKYLFVIFCST